jgi:hypothetical protein
VQKERREFPERAANCDPRLPVRQLQLWLTGERLWAV